jgi:hypothetical protein
MVAQGVLPEKNELTSKDEFGLMSKKVDALVETLKNSAQFAKKVGEGKFDADFKPPVKTIRLGLRY